MSKKTNDPADDLKISLCPNCDGITKISYLGKPVKLDKEHQHDVGCKCKKKK